MMPLAIVNDPASAGRTVPLYGDRPGTTQGPLVVVTTDARAAASHG
jgi:hypothetical protein